MLKALLKLQTVLEVDNGKGKADHIPIFYNKFLHIANEGFFYKKKVSEYDQEIPQSQTADNPMAPQGRAAQPSRDTRKTN